MQAAGDITLGWVQTEDLDGVERHFYVRQLWDSKGSALVEGMNPTALTFYAQVCGRTLARAHARAGDSVAIAAYLGRSNTFDRALNGFAEAYADQNERDFAAVVDAVDSGRIQAETSLTDPRSRTVKAA
jgi:predicted alpha/beta hydrolase